MEKILKNGSSPFLFAMPLFFCVYCYSGIVMDAILYVTQYVYSVDPARFVGDPAFEFGNQDSFGFFSPIFGIFIEYFGVAKGCLVYTFVAQFAWMLIAVLMIKQLLRLTSQRLWFLPITILFVALLANGMPFSHIRWFQYVPLYACSRSLSAVFGVGALALLFAQKRVLSLLLILVGTSIHPITAGWCLPFWLFYFFPKTRIPILLSSLLFPFSFLLHFGRFDLLSEDWLSRPLAFAPNYETISRFVLLVVFWGILARHSLNEQVRRISISLFLVSIIAFYWDVWGGYGEHVLLYQVQPWRAVWLLSLVAVPVAMSLVKDIIRNVKRKKEITTHDLALILLIVSFVALRNVVIVSAVAGLLLLKEKRTVGLKGLALTFTFFLLGGYLVQQYHTWCLQGFSPLIGYDYQEIYRLRDSLLVYQFVFSLGFTMYFLKQRKIIYALLLIVSVVMSRFMLLPLLPLFLCFFPRQNRLRYWGGASIIFVLSLFDGLIDVETRRQTMLGGMPLSFPWICFATTVSFVVIYLSKRWSYFGIVVWLLICSIVATWNYSSSINQCLGRELHLDDYLHETIFPQVKERGKMLFYVSGDYASEPRLRFMTGSYFTASIDIGGIFNRNHYRTALQRSHLLYKKERDLRSKKFYTFAEITDKFADVDTLTDRTAYLCAEGEISHLVTDKAVLSFVLKDSTMVEGNEKVYLYGCPSEQKNFYGYENN